MRNRRTLIAASWLALIGTPLILASCGGDAPTTPLKEIVRIPVEISERMGTWTGTLQEGDYEIWLLYRGTYSEHAKVCFMLKASGNGMKEQEVKGWMADALKQDEGRFIASTPERTGGFERPFGKKLEIKSTGEVTLEAMIFLGPGTQVRMQQVEIRLMGHEPEA